MNLTDDLFGDVRELEAQRRQAAVLRIESIRASVALCDGILQLENSAGFKQFQATLKDMLEARLRDLLSVRDDRAAAVLQGGCQELKSILGLMASARQRRETLANGLQDAEDQLRELERSFKPTPKGSSS